MRESEETPEFVVLYRRAFAEFGAAALWSSRAVAEPTPEDALAITRSLRVEGNLKARQLADDEPVTRELGIRTMIHLHTEVNASSYR